VTQDTTALDNPDVTVETQKNAPMRDRTRSIRRLVLALCLALISPAAAWAQISAPVLKWSNGGCFSSWCQTGWYSSPAVADLDGNGQPEVIWGSYDVVVLDGATGTLRARATNGSRVWPGIAVADLTGDGSLEIVVGRGSNQLHVYRFQAPSTLNVVWSRNPFANNCLGNGCEVRTLAVEDLETDGQLDVIVGRASGGSTEQLNAYNAAGAQRPGWPARRTGEPGFGWGMYNENVTVADMNGDGFKEVFGPTDTHYITALDRNGNQLTVNPVYTGRTYWSQVGVHVDHAVDVIGFADCGTEHRPNFADSAPAIADVNGDGVPEMIVVGNVYNCGTDPYTDLYNMPFILKLDRTRWSGNGFDWTAIPPDPGPEGRPLSEDFNVIETAAPNAVIADLDGDGFKEILYASYDGKVHAYWLDKTQHGGWPYTVPPLSLPGDDFRFASEPVVADLDNDGHAEVLFTSWPKKGTDGTGQLHVLDYLGGELHRVNLPAALGGGENGGLGAPTLANIDADANLEVVVGTIASGVVAYDLPNTASAQILWGTGRGGYRRTGVAACNAMPALSIGNTTVAEGNTGPTTATFTVSLSAAACQTVTVNFATANGTAASGSDYTSTSGTVTFSTGALVRTISVPVLGDLVDEDDETFVVNLTSPANATISDGQGVGTILDDDPPPVMSIDDCAVTEGNAGSVGCGFTVSLSAPSSRTITVDYATANGSATAGPDYTAVSSGLTFTPGQVSKPVSISVQGDTAVEVDEDFVVNLTGATNATVGDAQGRGTILDDDAPSLSSNELVHGATQVADLAADPGPAADEDLYRLAQQPRASYELVIDGTSGDIGPGVLLQRLASDNATVLQTSTAVGTGSSRSLRWENVIPGKVTGQHIRVRSGQCTTGCGVDDVYRIRAYETTYSIPRFNNAGSQATVLLLQNPTTYTITGHAYFWDGAGALLYSQAFSLAPKALFGLGTATIPALQGKGGTITVANEGRYGDLTGKAIALEPATGFSFDSPMVPRP
jgi:hypothetical protein